MGVYIGNMVCTKEQALEQESWYDRVMSDMTKSWPDVSQLNSMQPIGVIVPLLFRQPTYYTTYGDVEYIDTFRMDRGDV